MRSENRTIAIDLWFCDDDPTPIGRFNMCGYATHRGISPDAMRLLGSYALIYLLEGEGNYLDSNRRSFRVKAGDMLLLFPDVAHSYGPPPGGLWREFFLHFEGPIFDLWREHGLLNSAAPLHSVSPVEEWLPHFLEVARTPRLKGVGASTEKISRFASLLVTVTTASTQNSKPHDEDWFAHACRVLEAELNENVSLEGLARDLGMSYHTFRERFRERAGAAPAAYRALQRMKVAKEMLRHPELTNRAISKTLGFSDETQFSRRFRQLTGQTPREFRKQNQQNSQKNNSPK